MYIFVVAAQEYFKKYVLSIFFALNHGCVLELCREGGKCDASGDNRLPLAGGDIQQAL